MSQTQAERAVSAPEALGYFPAIDGMRALAVLSVMAFHLNGKALPGGFVGVDIFFVISGFVVTASIAHLKFDSVLSLQAEFYARRIARIMPPLLLCLLVTSAAYVLFVPRAWLSSQIVEVGLAAFFGVSNVVLPLQTDGYFMPRAEYNPFTHTWSLGVEEQFYLLFPPLMYLALGPRRDWRGPVVAAGVLSVLSLIACAWLTQSQSQHAFYSLASRYWELGLGMVLCLTAPLWRPWLGARAPLRFIMTISGFAAIAVALIVPAPAAFPFPWALAPVLGSAALIAAAVSERGDLLLAGLRAAPVVYVGRISYALYLWHWPIYVLMRWTVGLEGALNGASAVAATFALAALTYRFVETPIRTWRSAHRTRPLAFVAVGLATTCLLALGTAGVLRAKDKFALTQTADIATWFPYPTLAPAPPGCTVDTAFRPVAGGHVEIWTPKGEGCGKPARPGILAVAGDSHADAYARLVRRYAYESGREVRIYTHAGCPVLFLLAGYRPQPHCAAFEDALAAEFEQTLTASDVLFLPSLRMARYGDQWGVFGAGDAAPSVSLTFVDGSEPGALLRRMTSSGAHAVFAGPTPLFKAPTFRCSDWFNRMNPVCAPGFEIPKPELEARRAEAVTIMGRLAADNPRVSIWDPFPLLCPGPVCSAYRDGKPLVFDGDHLSGAANDLLYPHFAARMDAAFGAAKAD